MSFEKIIYPNGIYTEALIGDVMSQISNETFAKIAKCFQEVFNDPSDVWRENWTLEGAKKELIKPLTQTDVRIPILIILKKDNNVIGFSIGVIVDLDVEKGLIEDDIPHHLDDQRKERALRNIIFHIKEIRKQSKIIIFREVAIIKKYRKNLLAYILFPMLEIATIKNCIFGFFWTITKSKIYDYGIGAHWKVIYTFETSGSIAMLGFISDIYKSTKTFLNTKNKKTILKKIIQNKRRYFGKT